MKHTLFIFALLTASIQTFAQSPRIKLNQITKDSVTGSVLISSPTDSGMVYSRDLFISYGADTVLILGGDTLAATSNIISSVLSDGVTIIGDGTIGSELTADTSVLATLRALSDSLALVISSVTADGVTITGDGTVGSPLKVDTATVVASVGRLLDSLINVRTDLDLKQDQLNGTGFVKATGTTITYDNSTYLTSEVDGSVTNEIQTLSYNSSTNEITLSDGGGTEDLSNLDLVDSTRINATGDTAYYYQNGVLIGTGAIAGGGGGSGTVTSVDVSGGTTGLTTSGGPVTTSGTITLAGTLDVDNGGTGATSFTSGQMLKGNGTDSILTASYIREEFDTIKIDKFLNVDTGNIIINSNINRFIINKNNIASASPGSEKPDILNYDSYKNINLLVSGGVSFADANGYGFFSSPNNLHFSRNAYWNGSSWNSLTNSLGGSAVNHALLFAFGGVSSSETALSFFKDVSISNADEALSFSRIMQIFDDGDTYIQTLNGAGSLVGLLPLYYNTGTGQLSYDNTSSLKMKDNIMPYKRGLNDLMKVDVVEFSYKSDGNKDYGVIAEQLLEIGLDEFVFNNQNGQIQGVTKRHFTPLMLKAIQEQQTIIESIQTELDAKSSIIESQANEIEQLKTLITELSNRLTILENN